MTAYRAAGVLAMLAMFDGVLSAGVTYGLLNRRFFPPAAGTVSDSGGGTLTTGTVDSVPSNFTDPVSGNAFEALSSIIGSPFQVGAVDSVTINQATTSSCCSILSLVSAQVSDPNVTITGGSGTGYFLPTFRVHGSFDDNNASLQLIAAVCAGNASCILTGAASTVTPGFQIVDTLFTPGISASTAFTFGTPFSFFFFLEAGVDYIGAQATPGGKSTVDLRMDLVSVKVVDANGDPIPGAVINSEFLGIAAPEPASMLLCGLGLAAARFAGRRRMAARARHI